MTDTPVPDVASIAVLPASGVGDLMFALPALAALRRTYPDARLVLLGATWHGAFLRGRRVVDEVVTLPPLPGITAPAEPQGAASETDPRRRGSEAERSEAEPRRCVSEAERSEAERRRCVSGVERLRARRFDLAIQLHGGGRYANPLIQRLEARVSIGLRAPDAPALDRWLPYVPCHNERLRLLEVVALAGARPIDLEPPLPVLPRDRRELAERLALPRGPLAVLSPGASDPRRRWPPAHFAAVGDALAREGAAVFVQGSEEECGLSAAVVAAMREPAVDAGGRLSLGGLAALLARARVVVGCDSGPLHLAQAVGTATIGIYGYTALLVSGPLSCARHRHALSRRLACPVCGSENVAQRCPHDASFVADVAPEEVIAPALELWRQQEAAQWQNRPRAWPPAGPGPAAALLR